MKIKTTALLAYNKLKVGDRIRTNGNIKGLADHEYSGEVYCLGGKMSCGHRRICILRDSEENNDYTRGCGTCWTKPEMSDKHHGSDRSSMIELQNTTAWIEYEAKDITIKSKTNIESMKEALKLIQNV